MAESFETRRMRIHIPDPYPQVDPGVYAGVPGAPLSIDDVLQRRHVCFSPDELRSILERARGRLEAETPLGVDEVETRKDWVVHARVDRATVYFLRRLQARFNIDRSTAIRLGVYLLKEALEKQQD
ncbi:MAG: hypothetical protein GSR84_08970 [Desulfurococcales archaeon]|nr:hypothetical protein [Desulfurococcales archaeon]